MDYGKMSLNFYKSIFTVKSCFFLLLIGNQNAYCFGFIANWNWSMKSLQARQSKGLSEKVYTSFYTVGNVIQVGFPNLMIIINYFVPMQVFCF